MKTKTTFCPWYFSCRYLSSTAFYRAGLLLPCIVLLFSCSGINKKTENEPSNTKTVNGDTSLTGLAGITEKNPPVVNGNFVTKYPNGVIKMKGFYARGRREGQWISFFENGKVQSEGFFKNGLRDGKALVYYENGKLYYEGYYNQGKEAGKWIFYDTEGNKVNEKDYDKPNS